MTDYWIHGFIFTTDNHSRRMCSYPNCGCPFSSDCLLQLRIEDRSGSDLGSPSYWTDGRYRRHRWLLRGLQLLQRLGRLAYVHLEYCFLYYLCSHMRCCWCKHYEDCYCSMGNCLQLYFWNLNEIAARRCRCLDLHTIYNNDEDYHIRLGFRQPRSGYTRSKDSLLRCDNYWSFIQHFKSVSIGESRLGPSGWPMDPATPVMFYRSCWKSQQTFSYKSMDSIHYY